MTFKSRNLKQWRFFNKPMHENILNSRIMLSVLVFKSPIFLLIGLGVILTALHSDLAIEKQ